MAQEKFAVRLSEEDRSQLEGLIRRGQRSARVINRARILLKTDEGWSASQVPTARDTSPRTVFRTKRRYAEEGLHVCYVTIPRPTGIASWMVVGKPTPYPVRGRL